VLSMFLTEMETQRKKEAEEGQSSVTKKESDANERADNVLLRDVILSLLIAGRDTVSELNFNNLCFVDTSYIAAAVMSARS
jgi:hypothetical protein